MNFHDLHVVKANIVRDLREFAFLAGKCSGRLCIIMLRRIFLTDASFIFKSFRFFVTGN